LANDRGQIDLTERQVDVMIRVCETDTYQDAAELLGVSKSTVSHHVNAVKDAYGIYSLYRLKAAFRDDYDLEPINPDAVPEPDARLEVLPGWRQWAEDHPIQARITWMFGLAAGYTIVLAGLALAIFFFTSAIEVFDAPMVGAEPTEPSQE